MKKLLSLLSFVFVVATLSAQQIPNGSFFYWSSSYNPDGWGTWASAIGPLNQSSGSSLSKLSQKDTAAADYLHDSATLRLSVDTVTLPFQGAVTLAGFASLGGAYYVSPPGGQGLQFGYIPYTRRPDTLFMDFKFLPAAGYNDTALILLSLTRFDTLDHLRLQVLQLSIALTSIPQWQRNVAFPLAAYYNPGLSDSLAPDSMQIIMYASVSAYPSRGTTLWVDSLHFDASVNPVVPTGIPSVSTLHGVSLYPDPADHTLHIAAGEREIGAHIQLFNIAGQQVYDGRLDSRDFSIDTRVLPTGTYSMRMGSTDRITVYRGSVNIIH